jgi:flagellar biosynthesis anti-sigma factor FlgM
MKIDSLQNPWLASIEQANVQSRQTAKHSDEKESGPFPEDSVEISHPGIDGVRTEKVAALQNAIANGSYQVDAVDIADAMLRDWQA